MQRRSPVDSCHLGFANASGDVFVNFARPGLRFSNKSKVTEISGENSPDCKMSKPEFVKDPTKCTKALFDVKKVGTIRSLYFQYVNGEEQPVKCFVESTNHPCTLDKKGKRFRDYSKVWFWNELWQDKTWHQSCAIVFKKRWAKLSLPMSLKLEGVFWVLPVCRWNSTSLKLISLKSHQTNPWGILRWLRCKPNRQMPWSLSKTLLENHSVWTSLHLFPVFPYLI